MEDQAESDEALTATPLAAVPASESTECEGPDALPRVPLSLGMDDSGGPRAPVVAGGRYQPLQPRHGRPGRGASDLQRRGVGQCAPAAAPPPIRRPGRVGGGTFRVGAARPVWGRA